MAEPYFQTLSGMTSRVAGGLSLLIGLASSAAFLVNLFYFARHILGADSAHAFNAFNLVVFAVFSPVLCVAGFRLLIGDSRRVGSILPWALWLAIGAIFICGAVFTAAWALYTGVMVRLLIFSALVIGGLGIQSIRVGMRCRQKDHMAPSNCRISSDRTQSISSNGYHLIS